MEERRSMGTGVMKEPLYLCVHVPEFPAQALIRLRPELQRLPVVVLKGTPPLEQVCSANALAFKLGVTQGMTRAELDSFAGLSVLCRSEAEESIARSVLLEAAGGFTPRIEVKRSNISAFVMVMDMTGTTSLFGPAQQSADNIAQALAALQFFVQLAASANLDTAVCLAPAARKMPILVPPGREREYLRDLPLAALPLTPEQTETLSLWGLHTLGELAGLPEVELVVRLGQQGKHLRLLARGEHQHLMQPAEPVFTLEEFIAFDAPVELLDSLLFVLGPMLDQLLARAQNRSFALASVTVRLGLEGGGTHERTIKPALPVLLREILLKLLHLDLQAHPPSAGVMSIFVHAEPGDRSKVQLGLFAPQLPEALRLDVTLARIAALVGEERAGRAKLLDSHRPDSFTMERFTVPTAPAKKDNAVPKHSVAIRRCRPPWHIAVEHDGQRLTAFSLQGKHYIVQEAYGPWRRSGDWWSSAVWSEEEWDVHATAMADDTLLCLISHDLLHHHWQLEAMYD
jgi:protein ImuB